VSTLKDIAARAGLSTMAVSKILNGRNVEKWPGSKERADRVRAIAKELDYRPDSAARAMKSRSLKQIGAILLNTGSYNLYYMAAYEYVAGLNGRLQDDGYTLSVVRLSDLKGNIDGQRFFQERMFDGVVCMGLVEDSSFAARLEANIGSCVWLDCNTWKSSGCLRRDEFSAGRSAAKALVDAGCERVLWRGWSYPHFSSKARDEGVRSAISSGGPELLLLGNKGYSDPFQALSARSPREIASLKAGIIANDSLAAQQVLVAGAKLGLRPGVDYALVSCDEVSETCYVWPELSRVENWRYEYGERAADMVLKTISGRKAPSLEIEGKLREGSTCALGK